MYTGPIKKKTGHLRMGKIMRRHQEFLFLDRFDKNLKKDLHLKKKGLYWKCLRRIAS